MYYLCYGLEIGVQLVAARGSVQSEIQSGPNRAPS
jgi:hypothetical protein